MKNKDFDLLIKSSPLYHSASKKDKNNVIKYSKMVDSEKHQTKLYQVEVFYKPISLIYNSNYLK